MVCKADDFPGGNRLLYRALRDFPGGFVENRKDFVEWAALGSGLRELSEFLRNRVQELHETSGVGGNHRVPDAGEHSAQPLLVLADHRFRELPDEFNAIKGPPEGNRRQQPYDGADQQRNLFFQFYVLQRLLPLGKQLTFAGVHARENLSDFVHRVPTDVTLNYGARLVGAAFLKQLHRLP